MSPLVAFLLLGPVPPAHRHGGDFVPRVDAVRAIAIASRWTGGFPVAAELHRTNEDETWEVSVLGGGRTIHEVEVCAKEGDVLQISRVQKSVEFREERPARTRVSATRAMAIALAHRGGQVHQIEQDRKDGRVVWEVEILAKNDGKYHEAEVDARTGAFLGVESKE